MVLEGGLGGRKEGGWLTMWQTREFHGLSRFDNAFSQPQHAFFTEPKGKGSSQVGGDKGTPSSQGYRNGTFSQMTLQQGQCLGIGVG